MRLALALSASLLAASVACDLPPPGTRLPGAPSVVAPPPFGRVLASLSSATTIHVEDHWVGLSAIAPLEHRYEFGVAGGVVVVQAVCRAAHEESSQPELRIAFADVRPFLDLLAGVAIDVAEYRPLYTHTDDYPRRLIRIVTPDGTATFESTSQGELAVPWQLTVEGTSGVSESTRFVEVFHGLLRLAGGDRCDAFERSLR